MLLQQMILKVHHLLGNLVLPILSVCLRHLQAPNVHTIRCVHPFAPVKVAPRVAVGVVIVGLPQVSSDVGAVNL